MKKFYDVYTDKRVVNIITRFNLVKDSGQVRDLAKIAELTSKQLQADLKAYLNFVKTCPFKPGQAVKYNKLTYLVKKIRHSFVENAAHWDSAEISNLNGEVLTVKLTELKLIKG